MLNCGCGVCGGDFALKIGWIVQMDEIFEVNFKFCALKCENSFEKRLNIDKKLSEICKMHNGKEQKQQKFYKTHKEINIKNS